ncbi:glycerate kinase [Alkalibacillus haloalkaliphilus]|uniref:glycerate kinase n=1 Tax=Alkalibacillus haloalkaliphilus TaxID=94136 RepID=UPI0029364794|nr:glycerate kinase [Alkalibacillus haloalkaliphilus]MDV2582755.1 glycerate kinase [Alkalibacillus haloalkaliphilus]
MKITVSPDSFKGSLSAKQASNVIEQGCQTADPSVAIKKIPMADGGEGTVDALIYSTNGKRLHFEVTGPLGEPISTIMGESGVNHEALIEVASVCGLMQVPKEKQNPLFTTSYGLGELVKKALDVGYRQLLIGLGGSATNDGGLGMLQALGAKFYDENNHEVGFYGNDLQFVACVDLTNLDPRLEKCEIKVASDVENPLCGESGASHVFGPQKGASEQIVKQMDEALANYSQIVERELGQSYKHKQGAGAAGGLGFALMVIGGELTSGAQVVGEIARLEDEIKSSQLVVTGEGQSDFQTFYGKAPGYVAKLAQKYNVPCVLISGAIDDHDGKLRELFSGVFAITNQPMSLEECIENADQLLLQQTANVVHLFNNLRK